MMTFVARLPKKSIKKYTLRKVFSIFPSKLLFRSVIYTILSGKGRQPKLYLEKMMKSRIGCNTILTNSAGDEEPYTFAAYERLLADYTAYSDWIGALEFSHVTRITPREAEAIGQRAREYGFDTWSIHSEHFNVGDTLASYLEIQKHEAEVCAALGCPIMVCHLPNLRPYVDFARDVEVIGRVAELTRRNGVRLAVETCYYPGPDNATLPDADLVIQVVERLDLPDVGINVDTGHCLLGQTNARPEGVRRLLETGEPQTLPALIRRIGKRLFTTHLHDNFGLRDDHQGAGLGYIDWHGVIPALLETGYRGPLMMELTGRRCAAARDVPEMRRLSLEKELVFASSYLTFLRRQYEKNAVQHQRGEKEA